MKNKPFILLFALTYTILHIQSARAAFTFVPGDYYTSNYFSRTIMQYDGAGNAVGSFTLPSSYGSEVRGIMFGPDNLLYATVETNTGFSVLALDSAGAPQQTYLGSGFIGGDVGYGKITTDGQYLYVATGANLTRFVLGDPFSGISIYTNNSVIDSKPLPNGHLLVASGYAIDEITNTGAFVRTIPLVGDGGRFVDVRAIDYNAATNDLFVTELGAGDFGHQFLRVDAATGALEENTLFIYPDDIFLTETGDLLVGSSNSAPRFYDQDLNLLGALHGGPQLFVTQFIPEPSSMALSLTGGVALIFAVWQKRRTGIALRSTQAISRTS